MKIKNTVYGLSAVLCSAMLWTSCDDDDAWTPGEAPSNSTLVYFVSSPSAVEVEEGTTSDFTITVARTDSAEAIVVPLVASDTENYSVPASVEFPAGVGTTSFDVHFNGVTGIFGSMDLSIFIEDARYANPYSTKPCRVDIPLSIVNWELISDSVTVYEYYGNLPDITCELYQTKTSNGTKYMLKDFTEGYNFKFTNGEYVKGVGYYIIPEGGSWYGTTYWYFGSNTWNDSYPLYWQTLPEGQYIDFACMYANSNYSTFNIDEKYGWICLYCNVYDGDGNTVTSDLWAYLQFYWDLDE